MNTEYKGFFEKREEVSRQMNELDKEIFRLNQQREKLEEALESHAELYVGRIRTDL